MKRASNAALWSFALAGSLAVHGTLAATILLLPASETPEQSRTTINVQDVPRNTSQAVTATRRLAAVDVSKQMATPVGESVAGKTASTGRVAPSRKEESREAQQVDPGRAMTATGAASPSASAVSAGSKVLSSAQTVRPELRHQVKGRAATAAPSVATEVPAAREPPPSVSAAVSADVSDVATNPTSGQAVSAGRTASTAVTPNRPSPDTAIAAGKGSSGTAATALAKRVIPPRASAASAQAGQKTASENQPTAQPAAPVDAHFAASPSAASLPAAEVAPPHHESAPGIAAVGDVAQPAPAPAADGEAVALLVPTAPPLTAPRAEEIDPYSKMLDYLSLNKGSRCFLALASGERGRALGIDGFSGGPNEVRRLGENLAAVTGVPVEARAHAVTRAQCEALSFARNLATYPEPRLKVRPDVRKINSGDYLSGRIEQVRRNMLYLLLVDDEGKVEEIRDLFHEDGAIGFNAPMTLEDGPVETVQLLVALASDAPLETVASHDGEQADEYFAALVEELSRTDNRVDFGLTYFVVR